MTSFPLELFFRVVFNIRRVNSDVKVVEQKTIQLSRRIHRMPAFKKGYGKFITLLSGNEG